MNDPHCIHNGEEKCPEQNGEWGLFVMRSWSSLFPLLFFQSDLFRASDRACLHSRKGSKARFPFSRIESSLT